MGWSSRLRRECGPQARQRRTPQTQRSRLRPIVGLRNLQAVAYDDPEAAARESIPRQFARTLAMAVAPDGNSAVVLLGTNEPPDLYPYKVVCQRSRDGWEEGASSNGPGWTSLSGGRGGVETYWGEAPEGASQVVV